MPSCVAVGCQNRTEDPDPTLLWKYLPRKNKNLKELWMINIKGTGGLPKERNMDDIYHKDRRITKGT